MLIFSTNFSVDFDGVGHDLLACSSSCYLLFLMINIYRREPCFGDFIKNIFEIGLCLDMYEQISFKLGVKIKVTKVVI